MTSGTSILILIDCWVHASCCIADRRTHHVSIREWTHAFIGLSRQLGTSGQICPVIKQARGKFVRHNMHGCVSAWRLAKSVTVDLTWSPGQPFSVMVSTNYGDGDQCTWVLRSVKWRDSMFVMGMTGNTIASRMIGDELRDRLSEKWHAWLELRDRLSEKWHAWLVLRARLSEKWHAWSGLRDWLSEKWHAG